MAGVRSFQTTLCAALAIGACGSPPAQSQGWQVIAQPGGYKIARGAMDGGTGLVRGIGLTCERGMTMIALGLASAPARNPALLSLSDGKATGRLGVVRNGANNVWAGPVRDSRVLDMLARAESVDIAIDGVGYGTVSLAGANEAMRGALSGCWVASVSAAAAVTATRAIFSDAALPPAVLRDLTDFDESCAAPTPFQDDAHAAGRGTGLAASGVVSRADFNGDGSDDFVLDTGKLRCSRAPKDDYSGGRRLFVYTSLPDGSIAPSLEVPVDRFVIAPGKQAALRIHQDAVTGEIEDDNHPEINETLTMISPTRWGRSGVATPEWRLGALDRFPDEVKSWFGALDRRCAAAGKRLIGVEESISAQNMAGAFDREAVRKIDFNGDGVEDYVVDTENLKCGVFLVEPKGWNACGPNCVLVAFVSKAGGGHVVSPVPGFGSFNGNGDPDYLGKLGRRDVICSDRSSDDRGVITAERYSWTGVTGQRAIVRRGEGCG